MRFVCCHCLPLALVSCSASSSAVSAPSCTPVLFFLLSLSWPVFCVCLFFFFVILVVVIFSLAICGLVGVLIFND